MGSLDSIVYTKLKKRRYEVWKVEKKGSISTRQEELKYGYGQNTCEIFIG